MFNLWKKHPHWPLVSLLGRVKIRPAKPGDLRVMDDWFSDLELVRYAFGYREIPDSELKQTALDYHQQMSANLKTMMAILDKQDHLMGLAKFDVLNTDYGTVALAGIMLGKAEFRGLGYGTEAVSLLIDYLYEYEDVEFIEMETAEYNLPALRCFEKAGLSRCNELWSLSGVELFPAFQDMAAPKIWLRQSKTEWRERKTLAN